MTITLTQHAMMTIRFFKAREDTMKEWPLSQCLFNKTRHHAGIAVHYPNRHSRLE